MDILPYLLLGYLTFLVGVATPGPANLFIAITAIDSGRKHGLSAALGVFSGSLMWGFVTIFAGGSILHRFSFALLILQICGFLLLLWLGWRAINTAKNANPKQPPILANKNADVRQEYIKGVSIHLTNPKAFAVWVSIFSVGIPPNPDFVSSLSLWIGCAAIGITNFTIYALAFSSKRMVAAYQARIGLFQYIAAALYIMFAGIMLYRILTYY